MELWQFALQEDLLPRFLPNLKSLCSNLAGEPRARGNTEENKHFAGLKNPARLIDLLAFMFVIQPAAERNGYLSHLTDEKGILPRIAPLPWKRLRRYPRGLPAGWGHPG